jgi:phospho-N-acetylmuramoyl-pentapeptide-transferase
MLYEFLYPLRQQVEWLGWLNVLRYVPFRAMAAWLTAMAIYFALFPWFLTRLRTRRLGQNIREEGPSDHQSKKGTPTMGGSLILLSIVVATVLWCNLSNLMIWMSLAVMVGMGLVGLVDDILKIRRGTNSGFKAWQKFTLQILVGLAAAYVLFFTAHLPPDWLEIRNHLSIPFMSTKKLFPEIDTVLYAVFCVVVIVGTTNAVNLTDGLDGLAIVPVMIAAASFGLISYLAGNAVFAEYLQIHYVAGSGELAIICGAVIGAGLGFLWFNAPPASVFMGDTGSLSLGGLLGTVAVAIKHEIVLAIIGGLFVLEAVSVIVQVISFKLTGKRVFKMAPIHHHYEQLGWTEPQIVIRFWIVAVVLALAGLASLKLR